MRGDKPDRQEQIGKSQPESRGGRKEPAVTMGHKAEPSLYLLSFSFP
jgi:hypothetical protein